MLLGWMMYRTGMVPRRLAMVGLVGGPVLLLASVGMLFGVLDKSDPLYAMAVAPEFIWELALGVYLTATGGRVAGLASNTAAPAAAASTAVRREALVAVRG